MNTTYFTAIIKTSTLYTKWIDFKSLDYMYYNQFSKHESSVIHVIVLNSVFTMNGKRKFGKIAWRVDFAR